MKKFTALLLSLFILGMTVIHSSAADIDPILLDKPDPRVFECNEDLFFEVLVDPVIEWSVGGRQAKVVYFYLTAEFLFLEDAPWKGLDKSSFELRHLNDDGTVETYPLNYMMTVMQAMKNGWLTLSDTLSFATLMKLNLVFDVDILKKDGWSLIFRPAERGGSAVCEVEIPLKVKP